jgi:cytochrome c oxidase subunit 2
VPTAILLYIAFAQVGTWANVKYQSRKDALVGNKTPLVVELNARQFEWRFRYPGAERLRGWLKNPEAEKADRDSFDKNPHADDVHVVNELHVFGDTANETFEGNPVLVWLGTRDVLHSFNLPHFRVKQDALPGKSIPVWFTPTKSNTVRVKGAAIWHDGMGRDDEGQPKDRTRVWDIPCAELCGWGHWRMVGRVYVHPTQEDFLAWLDHAGKSEHGKAVMK